MAPACSITAWQDSKQRVCAAGQQAKGAPADPEQQCPPEHILHPSHGQQNAQQSAHASPYTLHKPHRMVPLGMRRFLGGTNSPIVSMTTAPSRPPPA